MLDRAHLTLRLAVCEDALWFLHSAKESGATDSQIKRAIVALREPDIELLTGEEAEGLIERLGLKGA